MKRFLEGINLFSAVRGVVFRFPLPFICILLMTLIGVLQNSGVISLFGFTEVAKLIFNIILASFFLLTSIKLYAENNGKTLTFQFACSVIAIALSVYVFYSTSQPYSFSSFLYVLGAFITLTFAPYFNSKGEDKNQCNYNSSLISNLFYTGISFIFLFGGISLTLLTTEQLFDLKISSNTYSYIWILGSSFFFPVLFLYRLPKDFDDLSNLTYPKGLSFILEYIIAPLLFVYSLVLYVYLIKILMDLSLPKGKVAYLVSVYGVIGVFAFAMLQPVEGKKNFIVTLIRNHFFKLLIAPLVLLVMGVYTRIESYGFTEGRYTLLALTIWFLLNTFYFVLKENYSLKIINISLSFFLILSSTGFWGVENISTISQTNRLQKLLIENKILIDGKVNKEKAEDINFDKRKEIISIVSYLSETGKVILIKDWFDEKGEFYNKLTNNKFDHNYAIRWAFLGEIGVGNEAQYQNAMKTKEFSFTYDLKNMFKNNFISISGYDHMANFDYINLLPEPDWFAYLGDEKFLNANYKNNKFLINILKNKGLFIVKKGNDKVEINLDEFASKIYSQYWLKEQLTSGVRIPNIRYKDIIIEKDAKNFKIKVYFYMVKGYILDDKGKQKYSPSQISFLLLIDEK